MSKAVKVKEWFFSLERTSLAADLRPGSEQLLKVSNIPLRTKVCCFRITFKCI